FSTWRSRRSKITSLRFSRHWEYPTARKQSLQWANSVGNRRQSRNLRPCYYVGLSLVFWICRIRLESFGEGVSGARRTLFVDYLADLASSRSMTKFVQSHRRNFHRPGSLSPPQNSHGTLCQLFRF